MESLVKDPESVIRQHIAAQLLPLSIVCLFEPSAEWKVNDIIENPHQQYEKTYIPAGYKAVTSTIIHHLNVLISDIDIDVRRSAVASLAGLALQLEPEDVPAFCLPIPLRLAYQKPSSSGKKKSEADQKVEELRITAANLLAELGGAASEHDHLHAEAHWVGAQILPAVLELCGDSSFRVRRSGVQALPRILAACSLDDVQNKILPTFQALSADGVHRIRKSSGECLVDMSRSLMILAVSMKDEVKRRKIAELRRSVLVPIADRLIQDAHKMVRQGMMQFLGPFIASFYPYQASPLHSVLPTSTESDGSNHMGIVAQFFPHATSMVSRLNSSQNSITTAPTPVHSSLEQLSPRDMSDTEKLIKALPVFVQASRMSALSLNAVAVHRELNPPDPADIASMIENLLDYFAALAIVRTGDENTDAEMRVYCAYSFPAVVLLLGAEHWEGPMKTCFMSLLNSDYAKPPEARGTAPVEPPLPVKRCLASSLQTVARILGPGPTFHDILPAFREYFLKDSDESVRLNVIRNFPSILMVLPLHERREPFLLWCEVVQGEEFLGAKKRSATNPLVLNWRQRDYLARSLPDLCVLVEPDLCRGQLWPMLQQLLLDTVSTVRDDAIWTLPIMLKAFCPETVKSWPGPQKLNDNSYEFCRDMAQWIKDKVLKMSVTPPPPSRRIINKTPNNNNHKEKAANFSDRQLYCRICAAVGLALRFSEDLNQKDGTNEYDEEQFDPVSVLSNKFKSLLFASSPANKQLSVELQPVNGAYQRMTAWEEKHLKSLLVNDLLGPALAMKEDKISNVRVTLMKVLQVMPKDIRNLPACKPVLKDLVEEVETWESFGPEPPAIPQSRKQSSRNGSPTDRQGRMRQIPPGVAFSPGPVDVDEVSITPTNSKDEEDGNENIAAKSVAMEEEIEAHKKKSDDDGHDSSMADTSRDTTMDTDGGGEIEFKTVVFEDGPIGMQLEPTADDRACRVFNFLDAGPDKPSPAKSSGLIDIGDVIVSVNGKLVESYDDTIAILKAGGRREVSFRPGRSEDSDHSDHQSQDEDEDEEEIERRRKEKKAKKEAKKAKKAKKEAKKAKKEAKKAKKEDSGGEDND